jgi:hypothetical protein
MRRDAAVMRPWKVVTPCHASSRKCVLVGVCGVFVKECSWNFRQWQQPKSVGSYKVEYNFMSNSVKNLPNPSC